MAASSILENGSRVGLWVVPEGTAAPTRGLVIAEGSPVPPAVFIACGVAVLGRSAIFASGAKGVAIRVVERLGDAAPLAPLNDALLDVTLRGKLVLQQVPSCVAVRVLGVRR